MTVLPLITHPTADALLRFSLDSLLPPPSMRLLDKMGLNTDSLLSSTFDEDSAAIADDAAAAIL